MDSWDLASPGRALPTPPTAVEVGWDRPGRGSQPRGPSAHVPPTRTAQPASHQQGSGRPWPPSSHPGLSLRPSAPLPGAQSDGCLSSGDPPGAPSEDLPQSHGQCWPGCFQKSQAWPCPQATPGQTAPEMMPGTCGQKRAPAPCWGPLVPMLPANPTVQMSPGRSGTRQHPALPEQVRPLPPAPSLQNLAPQPVTRQGGGAGA